MDYGDKKNVPFVLVPAEEIDNIKEIVNNPRIVFRLPDDEENTEKDSFADDLLNSVEKTNNDSAGNNESELPQKPEYVITYAMGKDDFSMDFGETGIELCGKCR